MLVIMYGGPHPDRIPALLDHEGTEGWTRLPPARGTGHTGRREGNRAWPGETHVFFTVADEPAIASLERALRELAGSVREGERLHVAALPVEQFF